MAKASTVKSRYNKSIKRRRIIKNKNIKNEDMRTFQDLMSTGSDDSSIKLRTGRGKSRRRSSKRRSSKRRSSRIR